MATDKGLEDVPEGKLLLSLLPYHHFHSNRHLGPYATPLPKKAPPPKKF